MIPEKFHQPWVEIDPTGQHGGLPGELGEFVGARLGDNPTTRNIDLLTIFNAVRDSAASLSMAPTAHLEGPPDRNIVEEVLRAINWCAERIMDRTRTSSTAMFQWTHAVPPTIDFAQRPIRFPLRNGFASDAVFHLIGTLVEIAESNANGNHSSLDPSSAHRLISPILHLKANIIRDWFDQEVAGEITLAELTAMFQGVARPGPTIVPAGESQPTPEPAAVTEALAGVDLIQWYPGEEHWTIFGRKRDEQYKPERIWQPEGSLATTEDVAPQTPVPTPPPIAPG